MTPAARSSPAGPDELITLLDIRVLGLSECLLSEGFVLDLDGNNALGMHYILSGGGTLQIAGARAAPFILTLLIVPPRHRSNPKPASGTGLAPLIVSGCLFRAGRRASQAKWGVSIGRLVNGGARPGGDSGGGPRARCGRALEGFGSRDEESPSSDDPVCQVAGLGVAAPCDYGCGGRRTADTRPSRDRMGRKAALSRSTFFARFSRAVGVAPMEYLLTRHMALAKDLLPRNHGRITEIAQRVGYRSASTFSVAFTRHVGRPPTRYAREEQTTRDGG